MTPQTLALYVSLRPGALAADAPVTCVYCKAISAFGDITEWVDAGETPLCPRCGIDFLVPGVLAPDALDTAHEDAFGLPPGVERMTPEQSAAFWASFGEAAEDAPPIP